MPTSLTLRTAGSPHRPLIGGIFLYSVGPAALMLMPMLVGVYMDELGFSGRQAGVLASTEALGMAVSSLLALFWVRKLDWRIVALSGLVISLLGNLLTIMVHNFDAILVCRAITSLATGTVFAVSIATLAEAENPEKAFGLALAVETFLMFIILAASATIILHYGASGLFFTLAMLSCLMLPWAGWLPKGTHKGKGTASNTSSSDLSQAHSSLWVWLALAATVIHFSGALGFWSYLERIAHVAGHSTATIGTVLAWALAAGLIGALLAAWRGEKWGFAWPFSISTALLIGATLFSMGQFGLSFLVLSALTFNCMWVLSNAFQAALVAKLDHNGNYVVLVPAAQGLGAVAGPALVALFLQNGDFSVASSIASVCFVLSLVLFMLSLRGLQLLKINRGPVV
jgi:DHA1 family inner membrane transport protein